MSFWIWISKSCISACSNDNFMVESALESLNTILSHEKISGSKSGNFIEKRQIAYPLIYDKTPNMTNIQIEFLGTKWFHMHEILLKT